MSAAANSAAVAKRSAGTFDSARATAWLTPCGIADRSAASGGGVVVISLAITACPVAPVKGGSPASIS